MSIRSVKVSLVRRPWTWAVLAGVVIGGLAVKSIGVSVGIIAVVVVSGLAIAVRERILIVAAAWEAVQNVLVPFLFGRLPQVPAAVWTGLLGTSEFLTIAFIFGSLYRDAVSLHVRIQSFPRSQGLFIYATCAVVFAVARRDGATLFALLSDIRMLLVPPLFFVAGRMFTRGNQNRLRLLLRVAVTISIIGGLGAILDSKLPSSLWVWWGLGRYWIVVKHVPITSVAFGLPSNMFETFGTHVVRRAISIYGDPLAAGYSLGVGVICLMLLYQREIRIGQLSRRRSMFFACGLFVLLIGIFVTYTRAGLLMVLVAAMVLMAVDREMRRSVSKTVIAVGVALTLVIFGKVIRDTFNGRNGNALAHLNALNSLPTLFTHPLGFGLPAGLSSPEGFLWMWWTIGAVPLVAFLAWMVSTAINAARTGQSGLLALCLALLATTPVSIEILGDTPCGLAWMVMGGLSALMFDRSRGVAEAHDS